MEPFSFLLFQFSIFNFTNDFYVVAVDQTSLASDYKFVAGFDGIAELGDYHSMVPPLNTVLQPAKQLGEASVDLLYDAMNGKKPVQSLCIETKFIDRNTYSVPGD